MKRILAVSVLVICFGFWDRVFHRSLLRLTSNSYQSSSVSGALGCQARGHTQCSLSSILCDLLYTDSCLLDRVWIMLCIHILSLSPSLFLFQDLREREKARALETAWLLKPVTYLLHLLSLPQLCWQLGTKFTYLRIWGTSHLNHHIVLINNVTSLPRREMSLTVLICISG